MLSCPPVDSRPCCESRRTAGTRSHPKPTLEPGNDVSQNLHIMIHRLREAVCKDLPLARTRVPNPTDKYGNHLLGNEHRLVSGKAAGPSSPGWSSGLRLAAHGPAGRLDNPRSVLKEHFLQRWSAGFSIGDRTCPLPCGAPRVARREPREARAPVSPARNARRPHRPDATREVDPLRRGLDAIRMAGARRWARRLTNAADGARRGTRGARHHASGTLLADRGARANPYRVRGARARRRGRPPPA